MLMYRKYILGNSESYSYWKTRMEDTEFISDGFSFLLFPLLPSSRKFYSQTWDKEMSCTQKTQLFLGGGGNFPLTETLRAKWTFLQILNPSNLFSYPEIINLFKPYQFFVCLIRRRHRFNPRAIRVECVMD
jgi:hypothetical protein